MTAFLYVAAILLWGFSWYALAVQAAFAPPVAAVFHRMALAAALMLGALVVSGRLRRRPWRAHLLFLGLGLCLFGLNFILFYAASAHMPSGLLSICFATASVWAALFARLFFAAPLSAGHAAGVALGVGGLWLVIRDGASAEAAAAGGDPVGFALALGGAAVFALGNMVVVKVQRAGVPQAEAVGWGMGYGAVGLAAATIALGQPLVPSLARDNVLALVYLAVFASVLAFIVYLRLIARLGPARAAYATVLFPIVAVGASAALEGYRPAPDALLGLALVLLGVLLALRRPRAAAG